MIAPAPEHDRPPSRVLVVEDDPTVAEVVARYLAREGYRVERLTDGAAALDRVLDDPPDLVVLDRMLPGLDGLEVLRRLRETSAVPVVVLTAKGESPDRIAGLEAGADDYLGKPFSPRELMARVRTVLARAQGTVVGASLPRILEAGGIRIDERAHHVAVDGAEVALTQREFDLLGFLVRHPGEAFRREDLLRRVWGYRYGDPSTVTVTVRRLREKVEADPTAPRRVVTVWGVGYRFDG